MRFCGLFLCLISLVLSSCSKRESGSGKPLVVVTTTLIGDVVRQIGGDEIESKALMGAGIDPHTFKPAPADIALLSRADLIFYNGLHLEGKMVELFEQKLKGKSQAVSSAVPKDKLLAWQEGQEGAHDPHIWFDVSLWAQAAQSVHKGLVKLAPQHAAGFDARAAKLQTDFQSLNSYVVEKISQVPREKRYLITSHDAYNYFGKAYGITVRGIQGISTETEAGLAGINAAVDFIVANKIPAIFVETSVNHRTIERVRDDCKARGLDVQIGGELYSDAMGAPGERAGYAVETYEGMVRYNVDTIVTALSR